MGLLRGKGWDYGGERGGTMEGKGVGLWRGKGWDYGGERGGTMRGKGWDYEGKGVGL